ncbi:urea transporter [Gottschalkia purinilytica]|uniref:Urea transporter n=1 Tax=Gottschalkia purinilytica TaxID=1503 RepID=A0A0L0W8C0_GOTPU|nr:urea transporter [Gottschalkia purinilytica]KNF07696.1 urea transporter [Gottschalkia purinilytica]
MRETSFNSFISACLKGISQIIFIDNAVLGVIILIAISIVNYKLGIVSLISSIIGTLVGHFGGGNKSLVNQGLFGYNSILTGLALSLFLTGDVRWIMAIVGALFAAIFTGAMMHFLKNLNIPVLTFPFVILTWLLLLADYQLNILKLTSELAPQDLSHWKLNIKSTISLIDGLVNGVGQVYFIDNIWPGILILIGVFWADWKLGFYSIIGSGIGFLTAYILGGEHALISLGAYGYNAVLTTLAVSAVFDVKNSLAKIMGCIAAIITVPITAGVHAFLLPYGLPTLSMPFVIVTWIFLGSRRALNKL